MKPKKFNFMKFLNHKAFPFALGFIAIAFSSPVLATTLSGALNSRGTFVFPSGAPNASSYDGPGRDTMSSFLPFTSSSLLQVSNFAGHAQGSKLEAFLLSELAAFDGNHASGIANNFGVVDQHGSFRSMLNTALVDPLAVGSLDQAVDDNFTFALQSPEGTFFSIDSKNTDGGVAHMLALQVTKNGTVTLPETTLKDNRPLSFNLLAGDIILFIEDMKLSGNLSTGLVPFASDFDYNDMVVVIRQSANFTEVPEPASLLLLGGALAGLRRKLKKA